MLVGLGRLRLVLLVDEVDPLLVAALPQRCLPLELEKTAEGRIRYT